jgi:hypothetical protein
VTRYSESDALSRRELTRYGLRMARHFLPALGFLLLASTASAQTIATPPSGGHSGDTVVLKDGTVLHGTVGEMTPGQSLTISLPDGQKRTIEWPAIDRVDIDRAKAPTAPPPPASSTVVHVNGVGPDAILQKLDANGTENAWTTVCTGSCDRPLASDGIYRVDAPGMRRSSAFRVEGPSTTLEVKPASSAARSGGLALLIGGGVVLVNGISFLLVGIIDQDVITQNTFRDFMIAGGVLTGVGAASAIIGAVLLSGNSRTKVTSGATTVRVPAWRDAPALQPSRLAAMSFPVLGGSF